MIVQIDGVHPQLDGRYELDGDTLTNREYHEIKRISGCRASEVNDAIQAIDLDVIVALALIALRRSDKNFPDAEASLMDSEGGSIKLIDEGDAVPPAEAGAAEPGSSSSGSGVTSEPS